MPVWFETSLAVFAALAAVFFFAKYRETAAALHECERMKHRLSKDLNRYRDVPQLRALRDVLVGKQEAVIDDEGREHFLLRDSSKHLHHVSVRRACHALGEAETVTYIKDGTEFELSEIQ